MKRRGTSKAGGRQRRAMRANYDTRSIEQLLDGHSHNSGQRKMERMQQLFAQIKR